MSTIKGKLRDKIIHHSLGKRTAAHPRELGVPPRVCPAKNREHRENMLAQRRGEGGLCLRWQPAWLRPVLHAAWRGPCAPTRRTGEEAGMPQSAPPPFGDLGPLNTFHTVAVLHREALARIKQYEHDVLSVWSPPVGSLGRKG